MSSDNNQLDDNAAASAPDPAPAPAQAQAQAPPFQFGQRRQRQLYSGKWTLEEEEFAQFLMDQFRCGSLPLEEGISLRAFLADELECGPKRISKKYEGTGYNGKQQYVSRVEHLSTPDIEGVRNKKEEMRQNFLISRDRVVRGLSTATRPSGTRSSVTTRAPIPSVATRAAATLPYQHSRTLGGNTSSTWSPATYSLLLAERRLGLDRGLAGLPFSQLQGDGGRHFLAEEYTRRQLDTGWNRSPALLGNAGDQQNRMMASVGQGLMSPSRSTAQPDPMSLQQQPSLLARAFSLARTVPAMGIGGTGLSHSVPNANNRSSALNNFDVQVMDSILSGNTIAQLAEMGAQQQQQQQQQQLGFAQARQSEPTRSAFIDASLLGASGPPSAVPPVVNPQALSTALLQQELNNSMLIAHAQARELQVRRNSLLLRQQIDQARLFGLVGLTEPVAAAMDVGGGLVREEGKRSSAGSLATSSGPAPAAASSGVRGSSNSGEAKRSTSVDSHDSDGPPPQKRRRS